MGNIWIILFLFVIAINVLGFVFARHKKRLSKKPQHLCNHKVDQVINPPLSKKPIYNASEKELHESQPIAPETIESIYWDIAFLKSLEWKRYEDICMEYLRIKNCDANVTSIGSDGGIDIKVHDKNGNLIVVGQCKAWQKPIGVSLIRELYGVMASERVKLGVFLTTSMFSQDAITFAQNKALLLIDGNEFVKLINNLDDVSKKRIFKVATEGDYTTPTCVNCNQKMVKRISKKGSSTGREFWGCINYPKCKNVMYVKN